MHLVLIFVSLACTHASWSWWQPTSPDFTQFDATMEYLIEREPTEFFKGQLANVAGVVHRISDPSLVVAYQNLAARMSAPSSILFLLGFHAMAHQGKPPSIVRLSSPAFNAEVDGLYALEGAVCKEFATASDVCVLHLVLIPVIFRALQDSAWNAAFSALSLLIQGLQDMHFTGKGVGHLKLGALADPTVWRGSVESVVAAIQAQVALLEAEDAKDDFGDGVWLEEEGGWQALGFGERVDERVGEKMGLESQEKSDDIKSLESHQHVVAESHHHLNAHVLDPNDPNDIRNDPLWLMAFLS